MHVVNRPGIGAVAIREVLESSSGCLIWHAHSGLKPTQLRLLYDIHLDYIFYFYWCLLVAVARRAAAGTNNTDPATK